MMIRAAAWTPAHEALIALALCTASIADMREQTDNGAVLFEALDEEGALCAAFILRVDRQVDRTVGVVVACGGNLPGTDLTATLMPHMEQRFIGCDAVRIHTARPGLLRKLGGMGYATAEIIFEKALKNG
jgi:hypothetical protein